MCGDEEGEGKWKGKEKEKSVYVDVGEVDRTVSDRKGKGKAKIQYCNTQVGRHAAVTVSSVGGGDITAASVKVPPWVWEEKAMYQDIKLGFDFTLDRPRPPS